MIDRVIYTIIHKKIKSNIFFIFSLFKIDLTILETIIKSDVTIGILELILSIALHTIIVYLF